MFTLSNIQIHQGRSSLGILTSAKMAQHYGNILKDYERLQLAGTALKKVSVLAEAASGREFFDITQQALAALDNGTNVALVETWLLLNLLKSSGEEINLHRDTSGAPLSADERYRWDIAEEAFAINENGDYGADEIKFLRLMTSASLSVVRRIKITPGLLDKALQIAKIAAKA